MAKRKNNEGCYGEKIIHGDLYKFYRFPDGHYVYAKKSKDLEIKISQYKGEGITRSVPVKDTQVIFSDYCLLWLKTKQGEISARVYDDYESIINKRIKDYLLGDMQIKSLTVEMINKHLKELAKKYAKSSIDKTFIVIKQVVDYGIENKEIPVLNIKKIKKPKENEVAVSKKEVPFITKDDMDLLTEELESGKYGDGSKVLIFIMHSGLRLSEATGLKWKYVSKDFSEIKIEKASTRTIVRDEDFNPVKKNGKNVYEDGLKGAKSADGIRRIPVSDKGQAILRYFAQIEHLDDDYVFISANNAKYQSRVIQRTLERALNNSKCSRKDYTPHCLRHGYGSILISNGVDIKIVSELLGHSNVAFTYNTYIGISDDDKKNAIKKVFG